MYGFLYIKNPAIKIAGIIQKTNYNLANANLFNNPDSISVNKDTIP